MVRKKNKFLSVLRRAGVLIVAALILVFCCIPPARAADVGNGNSNTLLYCTMPFDYVMVTVPGKSSSYQLLFEFPAKYMLSNSVSADEMIFTVTGTNKADYSLAFYYNPGLGIWQFHVVGWDGVKINPLACTWVFVAQDFNPSALDSNPCIFSDPDLAFESVKENFSYGSWHLTEPTGSSYDYIYKFDKRSVSPRFPALIGSNSGEYALGSALYSSFGVDICTEYRLVLSSGDTAVSSANIGFDLSFTSSDPQNLTPIYEAQHFTINSEPFGSLPAPDYKVDVISWLSSAIGGFFSFELMPGFSLGGLYAALLGVSLLLFFLKLFAGG